MRWRPRSGSCHVCELPMIMKRKGLLLAAMALAVAGIAASRVPPGRRTPATVEFMRDKLELSKRVLEGLATEDYDLIVSKARRLGAMSQESTWSLIEHPDYSRLSAEFRKNVELLATAAQNKNLDGVTLAYVRVTMSCVDCHKFVRGKTPVGN